MTAARQESDVNADSGSLRRDATNAIERDRTFSSWMLFSKVDAAPRIVLGTMMLAVFGPYVVGGLRTEQIAVYPIGVVTGILLLVRHRAALRSRMTVMVTWMLYLATAVVAAVQSPHAVGGWEQGSLGAGLDNLALPLAAFVVGTWLAATSHDTEATIRLAMLWLVGLMMANSAAVALQVVGVSWRAWWSSAETDVTVAELAEGNFRYSGLLNQPVESGFLYSLALVFAILLLRRRPWLLVLCATTLTLGAVFSVSKIFLLFGGPCALAVLIWTSRHRLRFVAALTVVVILGVLAFAFGALDGWSGSYQLRQMLPTGEQSVLSSLTASRFGEGSTLGPVVQAVWSASPVIGVGAGGLAVPYDNGFLEAFIIAGLVGVICYVVTLALAGRAWQRNPPSLARAVLGLTTILAVLSSTGFPALTANRCAAVLWLFWGLTWVASREGEKPRGSPDVASGRPRRLGTAVLRARSRA